MRIWITLFLLFTSLKAATLDEQLAQDVYLATVNAAIVFTSQDGLSSGVYEFTNIDTKMRMYNLPLTHHFKPLSEKSNLFMVFDFAYSDVRSDDVVFNANPTADNNSTFLNLDNRLQTYVGGIGGGIRYRYTKHSDLLFGGELLYSRVGISIRERDGIDGSDVSNLFSNDFNDNFSYKLFAEYSYHRVVYGYKIYTRANYKLYKTLSTFKVSEILGDIVKDIASLSSQTSVASIIMGFESDPLYQYEDKSFTIEPFVKGNYIWGDLATVAKISGYATAGMSFYWNTPQKSAYIYRYFVEPSASYGYGLRGLNLSLGFSLDF